MEEKGQESEREKPAMDPEFWSCLLQPQIAHNDPDYVGIRRLLLHRKAQSMPAIDHRKDWRCNGRGYVAYRNFIRRPRNWESSANQSQPSTPGHRLVFRRGSIHWPELGSEVLDWKYADRIN